ncbi:MAG: threonine synthase, partial [Kribbellaceae bacterium]|nr:threonine synthase [Kribbellaceae bacterium]
TAQRDLAAREGVFVEPASAAGVAGLLATKAAGRLDGGQTVVITVTGHGLKDIDTALAHIQLQDPPVTPANTDAVARVAGLV